MMTLERSVAVAVVDMFRALSGAPAREAPVARKRLPTKDELETIVRAVEGGLIDDLVVDWCAGRSSWAARTAIPRFGRLVGHPLQFDGFDSRPWEPARVAILERYRSMLGVPAFIS